MGAVDPIGSRAELFPTATAYPLSQTWRYHAQIAAVFNKITAERCVGLPFEAGVETGEKV